MQLSLFFRGLGSKDLNVALVDGSRFLFMHHKKLFKAMPGNCRQIFTYHPGRIPISLLISSSFFLSNTEKKKKKKKDVVAMGLFLCLVIIKPCCFMLKRVSPMTWLPASFALGKRRSNRWTNSDSEKCERARFC